MKLKQLIEAQNALHHLSNAPLPAAVAFRLKRVLRVVNPELQAYEEARVKLAASFGELSEDGRQYIIPTEKMPAFNAEFEALRNEEVTLNYQPLRIEDLGDTVVTAVDLMALEWLFVDEDEPVPVPSANGHKELEA